MRKTLPLCFAAGLGVTAWADFDYIDFSDVSGLQLNGTAHQVGNVVRLTDDGLGDQAGNVWHTSLQSVGNGFSTTFRFRCDGVGTDPADGMAFGIQTDGTGVLGSGGGDNAMANLPGSVVVNFQSFWNKIQIVATDGSGNNVYFDEVDFTGLHRTDPWTARIDYDAGSHDWSVWLDGSSVISANLNIADAVSANDAFVGLGAGTGLGFDNNDALNWNMRVVPEPSSLSVLLGAGLVALRRRDRRRN